MNNPDLYVMLQSVEDLSGYEGVDPFSNLDWGKGQARIHADATGKSYTIYKLVPVFEVHIETTTKIVEKVFEES
jgi:hypothetical protein